MWNSIQAITISGPIHELKLGLKLDITNSRAASTSFGIQPLALQ